MRSTSSGILLLVVIPISVKARLLTLLLSVIGIYIYVGVVNAFSTININQTRSADDIRGFWFLTSRHITHNFDALYNRRQTRQMKWQHRNIVRDDLAEGLF